VTLHTKDSFFAGHVIYSTGGKKTKRQDGTSKKRDDQWTDEWGADAVYFSSVNHLSRYLIIYKGTVLDLQVYDTLSEKQMMQISARLHPVRENQ